MMQDRGRTPSSGDRPETTLRRLLDTLSDARRRAGRLPDRRDREDLSELLADAEALARNLERGWDRRERPGSARDRDARDERAMDESAFRRLLDSVRNYGFDSDRTGALKTAVRTTSFRCDQARALLKVYEWDSERRKALALLYPVLTDPRNVSSLADTFDWAAEWRSACRELGIGG